MFRDIPIWFKIWMVICLVLGISSMVFVLDKCGPKAFLLGDGAMYAAMSGMCD